VNDDSKSESKNDAEKGVCGLKNLGNTCYMSSAIQALSNCPPLSRYMRVVSDSGIQPSIKHHPMTRKMSEVIGDLWRGSHKAVTPMSFLKQLRAGNPIFRGFEQHDSHELLRSAQH